MTDTNARILIVDDSRVIRDLLSEYLGDLGFSVDEAVDGQDGIDKALADNYDVVFCDLHMPRKNGYQVYIEVSEKKPKTRFIMTDSLPDELAAKAEEAGACCCLTKPFDLNEVKRKLLEILKLQQGSKPCPNSKAKPSVS
jgi:CheY-like chemotaxis protein